MEPQLLSVSSDLFIYLIAYFILFIVCLLIARWIFSVPTMIEYMKVQTANQKIVRKIISELAAKQGMTVEEIEKIEQETIREVYK